MQTGRVAVHALDHFDMWHDYMSLGRMVEKLCSEEEIEDGHTSRPQLRHVPGNRRQTCHQEEDNFCNNSIETVTLSRSSSLSDTRSLTSGYTCGFCKQNGESADIYRSHSLKSRDGKIICPILRTYTCPICDATGDFAHTRRYCPQVKR